MPVSGDVSRYRAQVARRTQSYPSDHPQVVGAKRNLAEAKIHQYIERTLAAAPPLTDEQRTRLAELLRPVRRPAPDRRAVVADRLAELDGGAAQ